jgi:hypothetical protein
LDQYNERFLILGKGFVKLCVHYLKYLLLANSLVAATTNVITFYNNSLLCNRRKIVELVAYGVDKD